MTETRRASEKRQRTEQHRTRLTPDEKTELEARAAAAGVEVAAYVRRQILGTAGPRTRRMPTVEQAALAEALGQLGYVGNNLNQLTRLANMGDLERPRELDRTLAEVQAVMAHVRAAIKQAAP